MLKEGVEPSRAAAPGVLAAVRLPLRHSSRNYLGRLRGKDSNPRLLFQRQASSRWTTPEWKRTRHDSNVRPQAPQTCALVQLSYGFISKAEAVRFERTRAKRPRRLSGPLHCRLCDASERFWRKVRESNPQEFSKLRQFSGLLGVPVPNLPFEWQGRPDSNREGQDWNLPVCR